MGVEVGIQPGSPGVKTLGGQTTPDDERPELDIVGLPDAISGRSASVASRGNGSLGAGLQVAARYQGSRTAGDLSEFIGSGTLRRCSALLVHTPAI
jgi:hypothetical protein